MITPAELGLVEALGRCWDAFLALPDLHPNDRREFLTLIHHAQEKVLARSALRQLDGVGGLSTSPETSERLLSERG